MVAEALTGLIHRRSAGVNSTFHFTPSLMMEEVSLETSPKNIIIQDMINSKTV